MGDNSIETQSILDRLAINEARLGEAISAVSQSYLTLEMRVRALEASETNRAIIAAREDERDKALYSRLDKIEIKVERLDGLSDRVAVVGKDVDTIKGSISKVNWAIVLTVVGAIVAWVIRGGLA